MNNFSTGKISYSERPFRREPGTLAPDSDIYLAAPEQRMATVKSALDAGITYLHAAHEREAASLGQSLRQLGIRPKQVTVSTTDGDALDRCPDTIEGASEAIRRAIMRKQELLGSPTLDVFLLYDFRPETHTPLRLEGVRKALQAAKELGTIGKIGATCYHAYDALADAIEQGRFMPDVVIARYNYFDQRAAQRLIPLCQARGGIVMIAAQPLAWLGGIPFVRFPNTWRYRNLTKNFYGFTAAQAHLYWLLQNPAIDSVLISMQTSEQISENIAATQITKTPVGLESLFDSFVEAITQTREGWRGLLQDELWEYRAAAEAYLQRKREKT